MSLIFLSHQNSRSQSNLIYKNHLKIVSEFMLSMFSFSAFVLSNKLDYSRIGKLKKIKDINVRFDFISLTVNKSANNLKKTFQLKFQANFMISILFSIQIIYYSVLWRIVLWRTTDVCFLSPFYLLLVLFFYIELL